MAGAAASQVQSSHGALSNACLPEERQVSGHSVDALATGPLGDRQPGDGAFPDLGISTHADASVGRGHPPPLPTRADDQTLSSVLWSARRLNHHNPAFYAEMAVLLTRRLPQMAPRHVANVAWAYAAPLAGPRFTEYGHPLFQSASTALLSAKINPSEYPAVLAKFLWAAAAVRWYDKQAVAQLLARGRP